MNIKYFFNLWKSRVEMFKRYDEWCANEVFEEEQITSTEPWISGDTEPWMFGVNPAYD